MASGVADGAHNTGTAPGGMASGVAGGEALGGGIFAPVHFYAVPRDEQPCGLSERELRSRVKRFTPCSFCSDPEE